MIADIADGMRALLEAALSGTRTHVHQVASVDEVRDQAQLAPAVHLVFGGLRPVGDVGGGVICQVEVDFVVAVSVRQALGKTLPEASGLMATVFRALAGQRPAAGVTPLTLAQTVRAVAYQNHAYYPMLWRCRRTLRAD